MGDHCSYTQNYLEGSSISGHWFTDYMHLGDSIQHNPKVLTTLGCHQSENKLFYTQQANGIIDLAPSSNVLADLFRDRGHVDSSILTLCLAQHGGRMSVGGYDNAITSKMRWTPLKVVGYFSIHVTSLGLKGGHKIASLGDALVDTGSTYTYFATHIYNALRDAIADGCGGNSCRAVARGACWLLESQDSLSHFPIIAMSLKDGATFEWPAAAYLYSSSSSGKVWCPAFQDDGLGATTTLGATWILHKEVVLDMAKGLFGFADAQCPTHRRASRPKHTINPGDLVQELISPLQMSQQANAAAAGEAVAKPWRSALSAVALMAVSAFGLALLLRHVRSRRATRRGSALAAAAGQPARHSALPPQEMPALLLVELPSQASASELGYRHCH
eukprot:NODE_1180_length_1217_cov_567.014630.p1 GENE.NODE_1180_length_1217_cov_567.014630~~NODE_1180_length_1217_cov_567.014630.p1  ORF type:complete len:388 (+),score=49.16 NODE_1180_length_1217_cov_567.014630:3-1166(+)